jgi:hypothetical protein
MIHTPQNTEENTLQTLLKIKEEAEKQLAIIDKTINDILHKTPTQPELTRETGKQIFEQYWYINDNGGFEQTKNKGTTTFADYNSFATKQAAEAEAAYTLASRRVRAFAKAVNGDWKPDWDDMKQEKYGIIYDECEIDVEYRHFSNEFVHQISFKSEELAAKALELFKPEWEILANP